MSLRSILSRLLSASDQAPLAEQRRHATPQLSARLSTRKDSDSHGAAGPWWRTLARVMVTVILTLTTIFSALWLLLAIGHHFGIASPVFWMISIVVLALLVPLLSKRMLATFLTTPHLQPAGTLLPARKVRSVLAASYGALWLAGLGWYFSLEPKQDRDWMAEVSQNVTYTRDRQNPDLITFYNVRNFDWYPPSAIEADLQDEGVRGSHTPDFSAHPAGDQEVVGPSKAPTARWETRVVDMSTLSGVDVSNSYWMGPLIAHTLVSFRFENDRPLTFSFEIRKEQGESFSALAGFFRRYELSLIAAEERDILYTRSNVRGEQVYLFPLSHLQRHEVRALFESYLTAADALSQQPAWYNTLTKNCTNIIFYMARAIDGDRLPWDYRIWVSGWLPEYLYDIGLLDSRRDQQLTQHPDERVPTQSQPQSQSQAQDTKQAPAWSIDTWYERAHINPKVPHFDNDITRDADRRHSAFSTQIRQNLPIPSVARIDDAHATTLTTSQSSSATPTDNKEAMR